MDGRGLVGGDLAGGNGGYKEVFAAGGAAGKAAEHGELADMGEGVGNGPLHEAFDGDFDFAAGGEKGVERAQGLKEAFLLLLPDGRLRGVPAFFAESSGEGPVKQVAHVGENLDGHSAGAGESGEVVGGAVQHACGTVGQGGQSMAQEFAFFIHRRNYSATEGCTRSETRSGAKSESLINWKF